MDPSLLYLFLIVFLSHTIESITGFGGTVIAVALGAHLYSLDLLIPVLVPLAFLLNLIISTKHSCYLDKPLLLKRIIPFMGLGLVVGLALFNLIQGPVLKIIFGTFVFFFSAYELFGFYRRRGRNGNIVKTLNPWVGRLFLVAGGLIHGIYASGGPLVVYYAGREVEDKKTFRSTLCTLWTLLGGILLVNYFLTERLSWETFKISALLLPALFLGLILGEGLHSRVNEKTFKIMVYVLLLLAGAFLVAGN